MPEISSRSIGVLIVGSLCVAPLLADWHNVPVPMNNLGLDNHARAIWSSESEIILSCGLEMEHRRTRLAAALAAIESHKRSRVEAAVEMMTFQIAETLMLPIPNFSVGMSQLKPSALVEAGNSVENARRMSISLIGEECLSLQATRQLVDYYFDELNEPVCDVECVWSIARRYNGQKSISSNNLAYILLVDTVMQHIPEN